MNVLIQLNDNYRVWCGVQSYRVRGIIKGKFPANAVYKYTVLLLSDHLILHELISMLFECTFT